MCRTGAQKSVFINIGRDVEKKNFRVPNVWRERGEEVENFPSFTPPFFGAKV